MLAHALLQQMHNMCSLLDIIGGLGFEHELLQDYYGSIKNGGILARDVFKNISLHAKAEAPVNIDKHSGQLNTFCGAKFEA